MQIKEVQEKVKNFSAENGLDSATEYKILDTMAELGEVAKEMLKMTNYGKQKAQFRPEMAMELGDLFYSLITIANTLDVDLETSLENVVAKYEKRLKKGSAGSESD